MGLIEAEWRAFERRYASAFYEIAQKEIRQVGAAIRGGLDIRSIVGSHADELWRHRKALRRRLLEILEDVSTFGQQQVEQELERGA